MTQHNLMRCQNSVANPEWFENIYFKQLAEHLSFLDKLVEEPQFIPLQQKALYREAINKINRRLEDSNLYLVVVGEFSSGKSTFINACLEQAVLQVDILQGTTRVITKIAYGEEYAVEIFYHSGQVERIILTPSWWRKLFFSDNKVHAWKIERLNQCLKEQASKVNVEVLVAEIVVRVPNLHLKNGLVLVDTPGINSHTSSHEVIAKRAITEIGDVCIVLSNAEQVASQTLLNYMDSLIKEQIENCWFIITKADELVEIEEIPQLVRFFQKRIQTHFGKSINLEQIDYCASIYALHRKQNSDLLDPSNVDWYQKFCVTRNKLWNSLIERRIILQTTKLIELLKKIYADLTLHIEVYQKGCIERQQALERERIPNLRQYVSDEKEKCCRAVGKLYNSMPIQSLIARSQNTLILGIEQSIEQMESLEEIKGFLENNIKPIVNNEMSQLQKSISNEFAAASKASKNIFSEFENRFFDNYRKISRIQESKNKLSDKTYSWQHDLSQIDMSTQIQEIDDLNFGMLIAMGGGAGTGAVLGSLIAPGIGTVIGGLIGGFLASVFGPSLDEHKLKVKASLRTVIQVAYSKFSNSVDEATQKSMNITASILTARIESYYSKYEELVTAMLRQHEAEKAGLKKMKEQTSEFIEQIKRNEKALKDIQEALMSKGGAA